MNTVLESFIKSIEVESIQTFENLTLNFLKGRQIPKSKILSFDKAIKNGSMEITEVNGEHGSVPQLRFRNEGNFPVFVPEGSIVEGLKQNRAVRTSFVIDRHEELICPVSCIEQQRWGFNSKSGSKSKYHLYAKLRSSNLKHKLRSFKDKEGYRASESQSETWQFISEKMTSMRVSSYTDSASDIYQVKKKELNSYLHAFVCPNTATGVIALIDNQAVSMDVFGDRKLFKCNYKSLLSGIVMEVTDPEYCKDLKAFKKLTAQQFIEEIPKLKQEPSESIGVGNNIVLDGYLVGEALVFEENVLHLEAFCS